MELNFLINGVRNTKKSDYYIKTHNTINPARTYLNGIIDLPQSQKLIINQKIERMAFWNKKTIDFTAKIKMLKKEQKRGNYFF